jgi:YVTN family beta-propeller protein
MVARRIGAVPLFSLVAILSVFILTSQKAPAQNFITVDYPGATLTEVRQINNNGVMAGRHIGTDKVIHGFVLQNGAFTNIDFPGAQATAIWGINDNGDVVGRYSDGTRDHGFLLSKGKYTVIDPPTTTETYALGINNVGQIVGFYFDPSGNEHGFLLSAGVYNAIDFPGSIATEALKVNNVGTMVGIYDNADGSEHGFLLQNGTFSSIDDPGATFTDAYGINNGGQIVGGFGDPSSSLELGFEDQNGSFSTINFAAATGGLLVEDINDAGQLVGIYVDSAGTGHGFVTASGPFAYAPVRSANSVAVFDVPSTFQLGTPIAVGSGPVGIGLSPNGTLAYVANYDGNTVSVINTTNNSIVATVPVGSSPLGVAVTPNGSFAYVANNFSNNVSVISTASNTVVATAAVGSIPSFVAITPDGKFAYVTNQTSSNISVISTASNTVVATISLSAGPVGLAITPNGSFVYATVPGTNSVAVISTASNTVVATIPVGAAPVRISITPDGTTAYVSNQNSGDVVSVIDLASNTVITNVLTGSTPYGSAVTPDGAFDWVIDAGSGQISVISTATNTVTATLPLSGGSDIAIAGAPTVSQPITQPLSPTQPNVFDFGTNNYQVQYPAGTQFSGVYMTVTQVQITQAQFQQRVAGTQFGNASCIVYGGAGGNCVDDQVTCSSSPSGTPIITCPSVAQPTINVETDFSTQQAIVNPGYLTTPIGQNAWQNIFTGFVDPKVKGQTSGFSEFVAVDLGATNPQGLAKFQIIDPQLPRNIVYGHGSIPVLIRLTSVANGSPISDAEASISVVMIADANGNPTQQTVLSAINAFRQTGGKGHYRFNLDTSNYAVGTYSMTIYGNAFPAYQGRFKITHTQK